MMHRWTDLKHKRWSKAVVRVPLGVAVREETVREAWEGWGHKSHNQGIVLAALLRMGAVVVSASQASRPCMRERLPRDLWQLVVSFLSAIDWKLMCAGFGKRFLLPETCLPS